MQVTCISSTICVLRNIAKQKICFMVHNKHLLIDKFYISGWNATFDQTLTIANSITQIRLCSR
ncbi:hypothetical protein ALO59_102415 [Pseudomonas amygdali pv. mellea]|nr:hypothetical protein ALO51_102473 [Pseudomonas amygdali]KPX83853.1 hypothetical protein ALO59_102415 [Pseudomonas amygdali pv. mellea]